MPLSGSQLLLGEKKLPMKDTSASRRPRERRPRSSRARLRGLLDRRQLAAELGFTREAPPKSSALLRAWDQGGSCWADFDAASPVLLRNSIVEAPTKQPGTTAWARTERFYLRLIALYIRLTTPLTGPRIHCKTCDWRDGACITIIFKIRSWVRLKPNPSYFLVACVLQ